MKVLPGMAKQLSSQGTHRCIGCPLFLRLHLLDLRVVIMLLAALVTVVIASCYDCDTCTTTTGERVRLACIDTPELVGKNAELS